MTAYTRDMSTTTDTKPSPRNPAEVEKAPSLPHAYGVHAEGGLHSHPMPIYLGAKNTTVTEGAAAPSEGASPAYNPAELAKALLALLGLLLGLTLALGGWQPHTSDARLGWSHGSISVVEGTDGDTGSRPLSPNDSGVLPAEPLGRPVDLPKTYLGDSSRFAPGVSPWAGPVDA